MHLVHHKHLPEEIGRDELHAYVLVSMHMEGFRLSNSVQPQGGLQLLQNSFQMPYFNCITNATYI